MSNYCLKTMETSAEAAGAATVRSCSWQEAYSSFLSQEALDRRSPEYCLPGMLRILTSPDADAVVAYDKVEEIVGFIVFGSCRDDDMGDDVGEIQALYTLARTYGSGLGQELMNWALDAMDRSGMSEQTVVWVLEDNLRARAFYRKCGFIADGTAKQLPTLGDGVVEIRMVRTQKHE